MQGPDHIPSPSGFKYYITFVDAHSWLTWVYILKTKSETLEAFKQFKAMVQTQFNLPIKAVQSDWGGEFRPFTKFLNDLGILHRLICPHTHHQNGVVERKHRHILELGLTLLSQANMPLHHWKQFQSHSVPCLQTECFFPLKDQGDLDYFLGIEVSTQPNGSLILTQSKYIRDLLCKTNMEEANPISYPMVGGCKLTTTGSEDVSDPTLYRSVVGAHQYVTITRPEIYFSVK